MKSAVVFAARKPSGFGICSELLDMGVSVMALDHEKWQTEKMEERWMGIGRNANLQYQSISSVSLKEERSDSVMFLPLAEYFAEGCDQIFAELFTFLEGEPKESLPAKIAIIHPAATPVEASRFAKKMEELVAKSFRAAEVIQIIVSQNEVWGWQNRREAGPLPEVWENMTAAGKIIAYLNAFTVRS